jgi:hypothetical protein
MGKMVRLFRFNIHQEGSEMNQYCVDRKIVALLVVILLGLVPLAGCTLFEDETSTPEAIEDEISARLTQTVAAEGAIDAGGGAVGEIGGQDTGATETALAAAQGAAETQAAATLAAQETAVAQAAQATSDVAGQQATATYQAPVVAELPVYNVDPSQGHLAWVHRPVTLTAEGYRSDAFANDYIQVPAANFVMAADITWDTKYGDSGCGFILRSDGNQDAPSQYIVLISRSASGHAYWLAQVKGQVFNFRNWYANWLDPAFEWQNGTTNRLAVVAQGPILTVYTNKTFVGKIDTSQPPPPLPEMPYEPEKPKKPGGKLTPQQKADYEAAMALYEAQMAAYNQIVSIIKRYHTAAVRAFNANDAVFEQGLVGMFAFAYSGYATCDYDNAWLWIIDQ